VILARRTVVIDVEAFRARLGPLPGAAVALFTDDELAPLATRRDPVPSLAARFAAKQAVVQALADLGLDGAVDERDVEVLTDESGAPRLRLVGAAAAAMSGRTAHVSLSHDGPAAGALVVLQARPDGPP